MKLEFKRSGEIVVPRMRKPQNYNWRPSDVDVAKIERLAGQGLNMEQIASVLGISLSTIQRKRTQFIEIEFAIKRGKHKALALVSNRFFEDCLKPGNFNHQKFYMTNMMHWGEPATAEMTGANGGPIETADVRNYSDEERVARIICLLNTARERKSRVSSRIGISERISN